MIQLISCSNFQEESQGFLDHFGISIKKERLELLRDILSEFNRIPYENISKLNRTMEYSKNDIQILRLPDKVWQDYRDESLGGTCYSLTFFLQCILDHCGIESFPVSADMKWGENVHCGLSVVIDNKIYWCDPGYLLTDPLLMDGTRKVHYRTESRGVCLDHENGIYHLSTFTGNQIKWRYKFRSKFCTTEEFINFWLRSFNLPSMNGVCLSRQDGNRMLYVHNNYFREVTRHGVKKQRKEFDWMLDIRNNFGISEQLIRSAYEQSRQERK